MNEAGINDAESVDPFGEQSPNVDNFLNPTTVSPFKPMTMRRC